MVTAGARANPHAMPRQQWIFVIIGLVGYLLSFVAFSTSVPEVRRLWALGGLPAFAGAPLAGGAVYRGALEGPTDTTPLGRPAVAWIGVVEQSTRSGKSTYTRERCRLGRVHDLHLAGDGRRWEIGAPNLRDVELGLGIRAARGEGARYWLGPSETVAPIPDAIVARCHIDRDDLAHGAWKYVEQAAVPGSNAEFAGCVVGEELRACGPLNSVAAGHLSTSGIRAMVRRMADSVVVTVVQLSLLMTFFVAFGAVSAVLALRRAAPIEVVRGEQRK